MPNQTEHTLTDRCDEAMARAMHKAADKAGVPLWEDLPEASNTFVSRAYYLTRARAARLALLAALNAD